MYRECIHCSKKFKYTKPHHLFCSKAHANTYNAGKSWDNFLKKLLYNNAKNRKKLSVKYLLYLYKKQDGKCALSGVELTRITGMGSVPTNASIDRIRPDGGYVPGNVRLLCNFVNSFRSNLSDKDFKWWCEKIANGPS